MLSYDSDDDDGDIDDDDDDNDDDDVKPCVEDEESVVVRRWEIGLWWQDDIDSRLVTPSKTDLTTQTSTNTAQQSKRRTLVFS